MDDWITVGYGGDFFLFVSHLATLCMRGEGGGAMDDTSPRSVAGRSRIQNLDAERISSPSRTPHCTTATNVCLERFSTFYFCKHQTVHLMYIQM